MFTIKYCLCFYISNYKHSQRAKKKGNEVGADQFPLCLGL